MSQQLRRGPRAEAPGPCPETGACGCCAVSTESQNPSMVGVGRALCGSPSPTPCRSRVTQTRLHRTASRRGLNISREGDSTASLGSLGQGSIALRVKKFFLMFRWNFLCFSLCPLPLVLSLAVQEEDGHSALLQPQRAERQGPTAAEHGWRAAESC